MAPVEIFRSRRRVETKLVLGYLLATEPCRLTDGAIANEMALDCDAVAKAVEALVELGVIVAGQDNKGSRILSLPRTGDETLAAILRAMGSPIKPEQVKRADRIIIYQQAEIYRDRAIMARVIANLPRWLKHAKAHLWPWKTDHGSVITLADVLTRLQDIAAFDAAKPTSQKAYKDPYIERTW